MAKLLKSKKGMALPSTMIVLFLILMLCTLIMTLTLYGTNVAVLASKTYEHEMSLDVIGYDFLRLSTGLLAEYTQIPKLDDNGEPMTDELGNPIYEYSFAVDELGNPVPNTIVSSERTIKLIKKGNEHTLIVTNNANNIILTVVFVQKSGGNEVTCWVYGERTQGISQ
jgi:type II secretory pathway pseudopilin PulG